MSDAKCSPSRRRAVYFDSVLRRLSKSCQTPILAHRDVGGAGPETVDVAVGDGVESAGLRQLDAEARVWGCVGRVLVRDRPLAMRAELDFAELYGEWRPLRGVMQGYPDDVVLHCGYQTPKPQSSGF